MVKSPAPNCAIVLRSENASNSNLKPSSRSGTFSQARKNPNLPLRRQYIGSFEIPQISDRLLEEIGRHREG